MNTEEAADSTFHFKFSSDHSSLCHFLGRDFNRKRKIFTD